MRAQVRCAVQAADDVRGKAARPETVRILRSVAHKHLNREDAAVYPVCERLFGPTGAVSVMRADHAAIEERLASLGRSAAEDAAQQLGNLEEVMEAHFAREERVLFPMMVALLSATETDRLARWLRAGLRDRPVRCE